MTDILSEEFVKFSQEIAALAEEKRQKKETLKALYEEVQQLDVKAADLAKKAGVSVDTKEKKK